IFALSPLQIYFAQEARTYSLVTLLCLASTFFLVRMLTTPSTKALVSYIVTTFLAMYAHYFAAFVVMAQLAWVFVAHRAAVNRPMGALLAAAAMYSIWIPTLIAQLETRGNLARAPEAWYLNFLSVPMVFGVGETLLWKDTVTPLRVAAATVAVVAFAGAV